MALNGGEWRYCDGKLSLDLIPICIAAYVLDTLLLQQVRAEKAISIKLRWLGRTQYILYDLCMHCEKHHGLLACLCIFYISIVSTES